MSGFKLKNLRIGMVLAGIATPSAALAHSGDLPLRGPGEWSWQGISDDWFGWDFHPSILIGIVILVALYLMATTRWRVKYGWSAEAPHPSKRGMFYASVVLLFLSLDGPLHHLADELLFCAHMLQHMILQLVWAPLLLLAMPTWLWPVILKPKPVMAVARFVSRPATAFVIYNAVVFGWHLPGFYNYALENHAWHIVQHLMFMSSAVLTWFVMLAPEPSLRATFPRRMIFIFAHMLAMKALGLMISMSDHVLYTFYERQPRVFGIDALGDQQLGGMLMWLPGGALLWVGLGRIWWQWVRSGTPDKGMTGIPAIDAARKAGRTAAAAEAAAASAQQSLGN